MIAILRRAVAGPVLAAAVAFGTQFAQIRGMAMSTRPIDGPADRELGPRVKAAFDAVRSGDASRLADLHAAGPALVPHVAPYVSDGEASVRREAIALLGVVRGDGAVAPLLRALSDADTDNRERAARILYEHFDPTRVARAPGADALVRDGVAKGQPAAALILLLGHVAGPASEAALRAERDRSPASRVKLFQWFEPVSATLPALVALSRLGDRASRTALLRSIDSAALGELQFLLATLREVDAPEVLHAIKDKTLSDVRETGTDLPAGATPSRRLCDDAVDAFARRLELKLSFPLERGKRFTDSQIATVRDLIDKAIPQ